MTIITRNRSLLAASVLLTAVLLLALVFTHVGPASADLSEADAQRESKSQKLSDASAITNLGAGKALVTLRELEAHAEVLTDRIPLPADGSLEDVNLQAAAAQGGTTTADLEFVSQFNARCDWYESVLRGASSGVTMRIIDQIPQWSAFRGNAVGEKSEGIATTVRGGDLTPMATDVAYNCGEDIEGGVTGATPAPAGPGPAQ